MCSTSPSTTTAGNGPRAAAGALAEYHLMAATRADLLRRLGRRSEAGAAYRQALALAPNQAQREYLRRRLAEVGGGDEVCG